MTINNKTWTRPKCHKSVERMLGWHHYNSTKPILSDDTIKACFIDANNAHVSAKACLHTILKHFREKCNGYKGSDYSLCVNHYNFDVINTKREEVKKKDAANIRNGVAPVMFEDICKNGIGNGKAWAPVNDNQKYSGYKHDNSWSNDFFRKHSKTAYKHDNSWSNDFFRKHSKTSDHSNYKSDYKSANDRSDFSSGKHDPFTHHEMHHGAGDGDGLGGAAVIGGVALAILGIFSFL